MKVHKDNTIRNKENQHTSELIVANERLEREIFLRKNAEQALKESEEKFRSITENSPDLIMILDHGAKIQFINHTFSGRPVEEVVGTNLYDYHAEEDREAIRTAIAQSVQTGKIRTFEISLTTSDSKKRFFECRVRPIVFQSDENNLLVNATDITARKKTEEIISKHLQIESTFNKLLRLSLHDISLELIFEHFLEHIISVPFLGLEQKAVLFMADTATRILKLTAVKGLPANIECREVPFGKCLCGIAAAEGKILFSSEVDERHHIALPEMMSHGHYCIPFYGSSNKLLGVYTVYIPTGCTWDQQIEDNLIAAGNILAGIIERKHTEEALQKSHQELEEKINDRTIELQQMHLQLLHAEKLSAIGRLSASIAHEFNNPLFGVMNVIDSIKKHVPLKENFMTLLKMANQECLRMKELIRDLQDFNRPTSGIKAPMDIHQTIDAVLLFFKKEFKNKKITITKDFSRNIPLINAIGDQMKQVLLNLLTNAADACEENGGTIIIHTRVQDKNIAIAIQDTGNGIKPEHISHIFEPFFTTKPEVKGTGLGLSISYGIIKSHNGRIEVKSDVGIGTTFTILLPIQ